jgi:transposase
VYLEGHEQASLPDALWTAMELLLPRKAPKLRGGRPRVDDRVALDDIVFVLRSGIP